MVGRVVAPWEEYIIMFFALLTKHMWVVCIISIVMKGIPHYIQLRQLFCISQATIWFSLISCMPRKPWAPNGGIIWCTSSLSAACCSASSTWWCGWLIIQMVFLSGHPGRWKTYVSSTFPRRKWVASRQPWLLVSTTRRRCISSSTCRPTSLPEHFWAQEWVRRWWQKSWWSLFMQHQSLNLWCAVGFLRKACEESSMSPLAWFHVFSLLLHQFPTQPIIVGLIKSCQGQGLPEVNALKRIRASPTCTPLVFILFVGQWWSMVVFTFLGFWNLQIWFEYTWIDLIWFRYMSIHTDQPESARLK